MNYVKSKQRVADHGEVFTPAWMVEAMLDLVKDETERIDSRFLEPACGSGNFLVRILQRKLAAVEVKFGKSDFERRHYALLALAKMRFGKTFTAYQLAKKLGAKRVLVVTFKPAVEDAWQTDLEIHVDFDGWQYPRSCT